MKKRLFSVAYMFLITLFFTSVVSAVRYFNEERISLNEQAKLQGVILKVLGLMDPREVSAQQLVDVFAQRVRSRNREGRTFYVGYAEDQTTVTGYAFPAGGPGFWGPVTAMVAVDAELLRIIGIYFYRHTETPGLGARMNEPWFRDQFKGLDLSQRSQSRPFFILLPPGTATAPGELDAITGATQTSLAIQRFLNKELEEALHVLATGTGEER